MKINISPENAGFFNPIQDYFMSVMNNHPVLNEHEIIIEDGGHTELMVSRGYDEDEGKYKITLGLDSACTDFTIQAAKENLSVGLAIVIYTDLYGEKPLAQMNNEEKTRLLTIYKQYISMEDK